jgi:hypothetical protein
LKIGRDGGKNPPSFCAAVIDPQLRGGRCHFSDAGQRRIESDRSVDMNIIIGIR